MDPVSDPLFEIGTAYLYSKARSDASSFIHAPSEDSLLNSIFALNHLRDWIYPGGHSSYEDLADEDMTQAQLFHRALHTNPDYVIVRQLCNRAKHVNIADDIQTSISTGFLAGIARAGDSLGQKTFTVDGRDVRSIFEGLLQCYEEYFSSCHQ